ncbi:MAG: phosphotransferase family protein [Deltaproteobacteria bacterium]|nr:MAG: phosphotransferase family protein [Deltaproteobacteria bacterium]
MDYTDKAVDIRPGEDLDAARLESFLKDTIPGLDGLLAIRQFPGGHSNLTYLLTIGEEEMVLRRPPFGTKAKSAHDMGREYKILSALQPVFPYVPRPLAYTEDESVMGCPFYVMERISGIILRKDIPEGLKLNPPQVRRLFEQMLEMQFKLHSLDYKKIGLGDFGKPEGYAERQVTGWSRRYRNARTPDAPGFEAVMEWLAARTPPDSDSPGIIHNDFKFDNLVLDKNDPLKIIGVLDWEMATIGDPLMDLGNTLGYWVEKNDPPEAQIMCSMPTNVEGAMTRKEVAAYYGKLSGRAIEHFDFYYCFGLFRLAVIAQQIYYRYYHGQTKDKRFKGLIFIVQLLEKTAAGVISASEHQP